MSNTSTPLLKQYGDLTPKDFSSHPVWVACHSLDYDEPWYDDTDEETFRPWTGDLPVSADEMYLVAATFTLADGSIFSGFATPAHSEEEFGLMQPQLFDPLGEKHGFWMGMFPQQENIDSFYKIIGKSNKEVFPMNFQSLPNLSSSPCSGTLPGFMKSGGDNGIVI